jgi:hypothetical protein
MNQPRNHDPSPLGELRATCAWLAGSVLKFLVIDAILGTALWISGHGLSEWAALNLAWASAWVGRFHGRHQDPPAPPGNSGTDLPG